MRFKIGTNLHGFTVTNIREIPQLDGRLIEMKHECSGAELCWLDNGADNKLFSVAFKTIPTDDTGVFHILEHSVLCGSEKFPVKEPFVDLLKSSMQTFLNAMTYPDKTVYPISSRNEQDYLNLMEVYLDAVFAPKMRENPCIFMQEGWHIEFDDDGNPLYKGVVFNEMKGALSDVSDLIDTQMNRILFPDSPYRFVSGGDPVNIPDLSYEKFCSTWEQYYHPSNARFYLDGAVPIVRTLEMIDSYLYDSYKVDNLPELQMQQPKGYSDVQHYPVGQDEAINDKTHFTIGKIIGSWQDKTASMAAVVLSEYLAGSNEAPLKKAVLEAELGQDIIMGVMDGIAQPWLMLSVRNTDESKIDDLKKLISSVVSDILDKGLDKDELTACINRLEFNIRSVQEPQGLIRCISALDSWLYGGDPILYLQHDKELEELKKMVKGSGFDELLKKIFSDDGMCTLISVPDRELGDKMAAAEKASLIDRCNAMTEKDRGELEENNVRLNKWQSAPDSPESKSSLPVLLLSEIAPEPEKISTSVIEKNGIKFIHHSVPCHGITHFSVYFSLSDKSLSELSHIAVLGDLLGELPTRSHSASELQRLIKSHIGAISFDVKIFAENNDKKYCIPMLSVNCSVLENDLENAVSILCEILTETDFSNTDLIHSILLQTKEMNRQNAIVNGHRLGMLETLSHYSSRNTADEAVNGYSYIKAVNELIENYDKCSSEFIDLISKTLKDTVCLKRMTVSVTSDKQHDLLSMLKFTEGVQISAYAEYKTEVPERMGISIPAPVSYAVQGWYAAEQSGSLQVAAKILSLDYLWNTIRVQGGAYGSGLVTQSGGGFACYSYRDPSPERSLDIYKTIADALEKWCSGDEAPDKYIISTIAGTEPLMTPAAYGQTEDTYYFSGISFADRVKRRKEILSSDKKSLLDLCGLLRELGSNGSVCVTGTPGVLEKCGELDIHQS